jgi:hypothetical protein
MLTIPDLASAVLSLISPALPYLIAAGTVAAKGFADGAGKSAGSAAWKGAEAAWTRITAASSDDAKLKGAIELIVADPKDADSLAMLRKTIEARLERNPAFRKELVEAMGGEGSTLKIIARQRSRISGVEQQLDGKGRLLIEATDDSVIENSRQIGRTSS